MTRWRWELLHRLRLVGLPGWLAAALALVCALAWWTALSPLLEESDRLDTESAALERHARERGSNAAPVATTPQQQLAEFERRFTGEKTLAESLGRLQAVAQRQGVQLDQAEFKFSADAKDPLARYAIVLPIKADYRALRRFTRDAAHELPGLAMEDVSLRRSDSQSPLLDAQLRFVLFVTKAH